MVSCFGFVVSFLATSTPSLKSSVYTMILFFFGKSILLDYYDLKIKRETAKAGFQDRLTYIIKGVKKPI